MGGPMTGPALAAPAAARAFFTMPANPIAGAGRQGLGPRRAASAPASLIAPRGLLTRAPATAAAAPGLISQRATISTASLGLRIDVVDRVRDGAVAEASTENTCATASAFHGGWNRNRERCP